MIAVVCWHNPKQLDAFLRAWNTDDKDPLLHLQQDVHREGCARTKNKAIQAAVDKGHDLVCVLDDDCYPARPHLGMVCCADIKPYSPLPEFLKCHERCLEPQASGFLQVTTPPSRGTPYKCGYRNVPVAASMSFWKHIGDYDACAQLVRGATHPMEFRQIPAVTGQYFPLCGMALAFNAREWWPWCQFIDVPRFDDIWMGWLFQKEAYRRGYCFNLAGPLVEHVRQSNVWQNLRDEAVHLERSDTLWRDIAEHPSTDYDTLRALLPV